MTGTWVDKGSDYSVTFTLDNAGPWTAGKATFWGASSACALAPLSVSAKHATLLAGGDDCNHPARFDISLTGKRTMTTHLKTNDNLGDGQINLNRVD